MRINNMYTLSIVIPVYNEDFCVLKQMLDSINIQQNVDLSEVEVIIVNDGGSFEMPDNLDYSFNLKYYKKEHGGVSAARNYGLDKATGEYIQFADCDDMFYNACGLWIVFREIENGGFDSLVSAFVEETRMPDTKEVMYINHDMDSTFVHGKFHRRKYLLKENIRWNDDLTIHEDSYFNCLCQKLSNNVKYCQTPFYLWRWRDESVCRHDPKYILKTYNNMLDSNTALVKEFVKRKRLTDAQFYATSMIYDAYYTMNKEEWINQENRSYRDATERRFAKYYSDFKYLFDGISQDIKTQIVVGMKNRFFAEGLLMESITFDDWIKGVVDKYGTGN